MNRIAILADVHGNVPALEAVIADLRRQDVDEVLVGGDLVGRGPEGTRVVDRIEELGWPSVRGNHEDYLLGFRRREVPEPWLHTEEWAASRWMASELSDEVVRTIDAYPMKLTARTTSGLQLVHGSPRSNNEGLGIWSSDDDLCDHLDRIPGQVLVCAHTHRPMLRQLETGLVVNVGAVGLPFNRDHRAQYAVLHQDGDRWGVEFRQVEYDRDRTLGIYESSGFLAAGGVTAELLRMELEQAAPFLVPFIKWATAMDITPERSRLEAFLEFYDPDQPMRQFVERLKALDTTSGTGDGNGP